MLPALLGNGVFLVFVMATTAIQTFRDVQHNKTVFSNAQQLKNMVAQFGMALGIALATLTLQWRTTEHYGVLNSRFSNGDPTYVKHVQQLTDALTAWVGAQQAQSMAVAQVTQQLNQQASLLACLDYFSAITLVGIVGALVMLIQRVMK